MVEPDTIVYNLMLFLSLILLMIKLLCSIFLGKEVINKKKRLGVFEFDILFAVFIFMICLFISRIIYVYFDIFLTNLDQEKFIGIRILEKEEAIVYDPEKLVELIMSFR